jgi:malonyl CoA-acyl carrier protein transacylase/acyl carrier protein
VPVRISAEVRAVFEVYFYAALDNPDVSFLDLGIDSLELRLLLDGLSEVLGVNLQLHVLFVHPTLRALAAFLGFADGAPPPKDEKEEAHKRSCVLHPVTFLYPPLGCLEVNIGRGLYDNHAAYRAAIKECDMIVGTRLSLPLASILYPDTGSQSHGGIIVEGLCDEPENAYPTLFAVQYALTKAWISEGVSPDLVLGHGVGEYAAACAAGVMELRTGLEMTCRLGKMMQQLPHTASCVWELGASAKSVETVLRAFGMSTRARIVAVNAPQRTVLAGTVPAVLAVQHQLQCRCAQLKMHNLDPEVLRPAIADYFKLLNARETMRMPKVLLASSVTGKLEGHRLPTREHWEDVALKPALFSAAVQRVHEEGARVFVEMGPGALVPGLYSSLPSRPHYRALASLERQAFASAGELTPGIRTPGKLPSGELTPGELTPGELTPGEVEVEAFRATAAEVKRIVAEGLPDPSPRAEAPLLQPGHAEVIVALLSPECFPIVPQMFPECSPNVPYIFAAGCC